MNIFLTGATGFIGHRVLNRLLALGHDVTCLVRNPDRARHLAGPRVRLVTGDILDRGSMRPAMTGAELVLHAAAQYVIGTHDPVVMERSNIQGTENVLELALELGIPRLAYVSSCQVFGDTHGVTVTEGYQRDAPFVSDYDRTKTAAHAYAEHLICQGAPLVVAQPAVVYGPEDHSLFGELSRLYLRHLMRVMAGPEGAYCHTFVDDAAEGIVRVAMQGRPGEAYILAGEPLTFRQMFDLWQQLTGIPSPRLYLPARPMVGLLKPLAPVSGRLPTMLRLFTDAEAIANTTVTVLARSDKAQTELGLTFRPAADGWRETLAWEAARL